MQICRSLGEIIGKYDSPDVYIWSHFPFKSGFLFEKPGGLPGSIIFPWYYGYGSRSKSPKIGFTFPPQSIQLCQGFWGCEEWALIWVNLPKRLCSWVGIQVLYFWIMIFHQPDKTDISDVRILHNTAFTNSYSPLEFSIANT